MLWIYGSSSTRWLWDLQHVTCVSSDVLCAPFDLEGRLKATLICGGSCLFQLLAPLPSPDIKAKHGVHECMDPAAVEHIFSILLAFTLWVVKHYSEFSQPSKSSGRAYYTCTSLVLLDPLYYIIFQWKLMITKQSGFQQPVRRANILHETADKQQIETQRVQTAHAATSDTALHMFYKFKWFSSIQLITCIFETTTIYQFQYICEMEHKLHWSRSVNWVSTDLFVDVMSSVN